MRATQPRGDPTRRSVHRRARTPGSVRCCRRRLGAAAARRATTASRRAGAVLAWPGVDRRAHGRPLHRQRGGPRLHLENGAAPTGGTRHVVPRSLPAHEGGATCRRPAGRDRPADARIAAARAPRPVSNCVLGLLPPARRARLPSDAWRRSGDRARAWRGDVLVRQGRPDGAGGERVLRQRDQRDAGRRVPVRVPADRRAREVQDRVLAARRGQAAAPPDTEAAHEPSGAGDWRRVRHRTGDSASAGRRRGLCRGRRPGCGDGRQRRRGDRRARIGRSAFRWT